MNLRFVPADDMCLEPWALSTMSSFECFMLHDKLCTMFGELATLPRLICAVCPAQCLLKEPDFSLTPFLRLSLEFCFSSKPLIKHYLSSDMSAF